MQKVLLASVSTLAAMAAGQALAGTDYSKNWQAQIGDTAAVQSASNGGKGITIGVVDTGVVASNREIAGRVSTASACAAVTFKCSNGDTDDNGHGTSVASIAAGQFSSTAPISMSGVAPQASIVAEKVLNASGSGYDSDVANGIIKATQAGAKVINLSLTYLPTMSVINAVNYAVANNVVIVWAGGNSAQALNGGANSNGFNIAVASHLIFAGSVNSANQLSSFSNTPGGGALTFGKTKTSYASLWLMAPGESIVAPAVQYGAGGYAYWTGTSMSTPEISGAVALLEATWPVLIRNGTASAVLFQTATDLGAKGADSTYGDGLLNLTQAFQPIGGLTVTQANGQSIGVTQLTGTMITSGALGPVSAVKTQLANYTAFDSYQRNFTVNLSGLVGQATTSSNANAIVITPTASQTTTTSGGGKFTLVSPAAVSFAEGVFGPDGHASINDNLLGYRPNDVAYAEFVGTGGSYLAVGTGVDSTFSFAQAAWGSQSLVAQQADALGASSALVGLAQGGASASFGLPATSRLRIAASWSASPPPVGSAIASQRNRSDATAAAVTLTAALTHRFSVGATISTLSEDNALLGTTYSGDGPLGLGAHRTSRLVGLASAWDIGDERSLMADLSAVRTDGGAVGSGLITKVSPLTSLAWGVSVIQGNALARGDALSVSVRQPLRVVSGTLDLATTTVDDQGFSHTVATSMSLAPEGHETDLTLGYASPVTRGASFRGSVSWRSDADDMAGRQDVAVKFGTRLAF